MLPLALPPDDLTKSDGNCLFHALVSQLLRAEVNSQSELKCLDHLAMREKICEFMMTSELPCVKNMRKSWANFNLGEYNTYWTTMMTGVNLIWGEGPVIQAAAWFLQRDIYIVSEQATIDKPMMPFSGNRHSDKPCSGANLWLGFHTCGHYQTLNLEQSQIDFQTSNLHHQSVQEAVKVQIRFVILKSLLPFSCILTVNKPQLLNCKDSVCGRSAGKCRPQPRRPNLLFSFYQHRPPSGYH